MMKYFAIIIVVSLVLIALRLAVRSGAADLDSQQTKRRFFGIPVAEQITIRDLPNQLTRLVNGQTEFQFLGIHSNGTDCIYLMYENDTFNIDYEAMSEDQIPYLDRLKDYAKTKQIKTTTTTYSNAPHYESDNTAPVIQLKTNADLENAVEIARDIQIGVFGNNEDTVYEVVP
jgi:hypothetical protein